MSGHAIVPDEPGKLADREIDRFADDIPFLSLLAGHPAVQPDLTPKDLFASQPWRLITSDDGQKAMLRAFNPFYNRAVNFIAFLCLGMEGTTSPAMAVIRAAAPMLTAEYLEADPLYATCDLTDTADANRLSRHNWCQEKFNLFMAAGDYNMNKVIGNLQRMMGATTFQQTISNMFVQPSHRVKDSHNQLRRVWTLNAGLRA